MSISSWLVDTVTVASQTGANASGDPSYTAQRTVRARVVEGREAGRSQNPPATVVYAEEQLLVTDRLWLPGTTTTKASDARRPTLVTRARDLRGARVLWKATL